MSRDDNLPAVVSALFSPQAVCEVIDGREVIDEPRPRRVKVATPAHLNSSPPTAGVRCHPIRAMSQRPFRHSPWFPLPGRRDGLAVCRLEVEPKLAAFPLLITNLPTIAVLPLEKSLQQLETFPTRS